MGYFSAITKTGCGLVGARITANPTEVGVHQDIQSTIDFILEVEKLKGVLRKTKPVGQARYENSAEHSWQIALFALAMKPYANADVNMEVVLQMLLLHDIVEIDAGDTLVYDDAGAANKYEEEHQAAQRIFALLPKAMGKRFLTLWEEFEAEETPEAQYARGMDRVLPILQNLANDGQSWVEHGIRKVQVLEKNGKVAKASSALWNMIVPRLDEAERLGYLKG